MALFPIHFACTVIATFMLCLDLAIYFFLKKITLVDSLLIRLLWFVEVGFFYIY